MATCSEIPVTSLHIGDKIPTLPQEESWVVSGIIEGEQRYIVTIHLKSQPEVHRTVFVPITQKVIIRR